MSEKFMLPIDEATGWYVCPLCKFEQSKPGDFCLKCGYDPHETITSGDGSGVSEAPLSTQLVSILDLETILEFVVLGYTDEELTRGQKRRSKTAAKKLSDLIREARKDEVKEISKAIERIENMNNTDMGMNYWVENRLKELSDEVS